MNQTKNAARKSREEALFITETAATELDVSYCAETKPENSTVYKMKGDVDQDKWKKLLGLEQKFIESLKKINPNETLSI